MLVRYHQRTTLTRAAEEAWALNLGEPVTRTPTPSTSRANKAGDRIRRFARDLTVPDGIDIWDEIEVLGAWRREFAAPMSSTGMTLRSVVRTCTGLDPRGRVITRHKREGQIVAKLVRDGTRLAKMEDIAGCRAILPALDDVLAVSDRIHTHARTIDVQSIDDYNLEPRHGGYRALHLHALRDGRQVEIQLRTKRQHDWAEAVEAWDNASGHDIKHENGPPEIVQAFQMAAEYQSEWDHGRGSTVWATLNRDRSQALFQKWLSENRGGGRHG